MLNITPQRSAEGAKSYFAKADYYAEGQEIVGHWGGKGAVLLGLFGKVDKQAFDDLCDNLNPNTGKPLTALTRGERRVGYDFTWSAPKSVSVVHALTGDESIVKVFRESIRETMAEMEAQMQTRVRKGGAQEDRTTGNFVYSEFVHLTSRPVNGMPCPQLHAHVFTFNATHDFEEDQWKAGQFGRIKQDGYYWQAVQQARFARGLQELGYATRRTKDAFEIVGVPEETLRKFSLRSAVIERTARELGITDLKTKSRLAATTREAKLDGIPYPQLVKTWEGQLTPAERTAIKHVRGVPQPAPTKDQEHLRFAADHLFERSSVVDERRLMALALRHGLGEVTPEGMRTATEGLDLLKRADGGQTWVTTPRVLAEEHAMLRFAAAGKGTCRPLALPGGDWEHTLAASRLSGEQQAAVTHLLTSADRVMILRGVAGSGKTTLTTEAVAAIKEHGKAVVPVAPTVKAVNVLKEDGFTEAATLARLLVDEKLQAKAQRGVIWLDEAGLVGSRAMARLFALAEKLQARVVLAGDKKQLAAVERGSPLRVLEEIGGLKIAEVKEIRRQGGEYREAVKLLSEGRAAEGLAKLESMGCVKLLPVWDRYEPVAKEYAQMIAGAKDREKAALIVCPTHVEGNKVNEAVRAELRDRGLIGKKERELPQLVPLQWTEAERGDIARYGGEEVLQFHRNSGRFKAGERVMAAEAPDARSKPEHFAVYLPSVIPVSPGDLLRATAKGTSKDGKHTLSNGGVYRVAKFNRSGDVVLDNGWTVSKSFGHWAHAYVNTAYAAQGRTVQHVLVVQSAMSAAAGGRESFYVAASRGKASISVYTDDKQALREAVARTRPRLSATEVAGGPGPQAHQASLWQRMRQTMANVQMAARVAARSLRPAEVRRREMSYGR